VVIVTKIFSREMVTCKYLGSSGEIQTSLFQGNFALAES